jgi:integrase
MGNLLQFPTIQYWLNRVHSSHTRKHHLKAVVRLLQNNPQFEHNPDAWILWAKPPQDDGTERFRESTQIQRTIENATNDQNDNEAKRTKTSLRSYLRKHGVNNLVKDDLTIDPNKTYKPYTREHVTEITNKLRLDTHKLFTTIAHTSGLRTEAILKLRWKHIQEEYDTQDYIHLNFEPQFLRKEKAVSPYAFIGPDSRKLIEKLIQANIITKSDDSPIIPLAYNSVNKAVARVKRKVVIKENINTLHGFRFYFIETLRKVEPQIDYDDQKVMAAHEIKRTRLRYTLQDLDKYRNLYKRAYPYLSINAQPTDKKLSELETRYAQLQETHQGKIESLEKRIDALTKLIQPGMRLNLEEASIPNIQELVKSYLNSLSPEELKGYLQSLADQRKRALELKTFTPQQLEQLQIALKNSKHLQGSPQ